MHHYIFVLLLYFKYYEFSDIHTPVPVFVWPGRYDFRDIELKICIILLPTSIPFPNKSQNLKKVF